MSAAEFTLEVVALERDRLRRDTVVVRVTGATLTFDVEAREVLVLFDRPRQAASAAAQTQSTATNTTRKPRITEPSKKISGQR